MKDTIVPPPTIPGERGFARVSGHNRPFAAFKPGLDDLSAPVSAVPAEEPAEVETPAAPGSNNT